MRRIPRLGPRLVCPLCWCALLAPAAGAEGYPRSVDAIIRTLGD